MFYKKRMFEIMSLCWICITASLNITSSKYMDLIFKELQVLSRYDMKMLFQMFLEIWLKQSLTNIIS